MNPIAVKSGKSTNAFLNVFRILSLTAAIALIIFAASAAYGIYSNDSMSLCWLGLTREFFKDEQGAIRDLDAAIKSNPNNANAYLFRGVASYNIGDKQGTVGDLLQTVKLYPNCESAYYGLGFAYTSLGDNQKCIASNSKAIKLYDEDSLGYLNRGIGYLRLGNYQRAVNDLNQAIKLCPSIAYSLVANHTKSILEDFNSAQKLKLDPSSEFDQCLGSYLTGDYSTAIRGFSQIISKSRTYGRSYLSVVYYCRGCAYCKIDKLQNAIDDFDQVVQLLPDNFGKNSSEYVFTNKIKSYAYYQRAMTSCLVGDKYGALEDLQQAINRNPDGQFYVERGFIRYELGDMQGATNDFRRAVHTDSGVNSIYNVQSTSKPAVISLWHGLMNLVIGNDSSAISDFNKAIKEDPYYAYAYLYRGVVYCVELGDFQKAMSDLEIVKKLNPKIPSVYRYIALINTTRGDRMAALKNLDQALKIDPKNNSIYAKRGEIREQLGDLNGAIGDYSQAIKFSTGHTHSMFDANGNFTGGFEIFSMPRVFMEYQLLHPEPYYLRGCILYKLGKFQLASKDLDQAIKFDPNYAPFYSMRSVVYYALGDRVQALKDHQRELTLDPSDTLDPLLVLIGLLYSGTL